MKKYTILFFVAVAVLVLFSLERITECWTVSALDNDKEIFDRIVVIKGKVTELNNSDLGETPAHGSTPIIFQKDGCSSCIIVTRPDIEGNYEIQVGRGKYRLIVIAPSPPQHDLLAPNQERYIDTKKTASQVVNFDVKLRLPN